MITLCVHFFGALFAIDELFRCVNFSFELVQSIKTIF